MSRRRRGLSDDERQLWEAVARSARPLRPLPLPPAVAERVADAPAAAVAAATSPAAGQAMPHPPGKAMPRSAPSPASIDRRTRTRIARGALEIEARLDLHGLTQSRAHHTLRRFLEAAQARGAKLVLIITGKGRPPGEEDPPFERAERGILKRAVPAWLAAAEFRHLVESFDEAGRRHGGGGALYVRLRRRKV